MNNDYNIWFLLIIIGQVSSIKASNEGIPYNQPSFCQNASWDLNATTFTDVNTTGLYPVTIFINRNNTIYIPNQSNNRLLVWSETNLALTNNISINSSNLFDIFVTETDNIYVGVSTSLFGINKLSLTSTSLHRIMFTCKECQGIFIDISNNIYCSMRYGYQVVKKSLDTTSNILTVVAGTGSSGSTSTTLNEPYGIFVDDNFDLYVADIANNRIQLFHSGELSATTVAGSGSPTATISLNRPTSVVLDADKYLFIVDCDNHRIVASNAYGFRCIVGCSGQGSTTDKLKYPWSMAFDSDGNIYVADQNNHRIQKFLLLTGLCNQTTTTTSVSVQNVTTNVTETIANGSYNQPKFDTLAHWNPDGITFASGTIVGTSCYSIFIDQNNTIYIGNTQYSRIQIWLNGSASSAQIISTNLTQPYALFVSSNGDIYTSNSYPSSSYRVEQRRLNPSSTVTVMSVNSNCFGLFVDIANNVYCSLTNLHQVVKKPVNSISQQPLIVAGVGCAASSSNGLNSPYGIFVDTNFDLYVADCNNNRIQLFPFSQLKGNTVAGSSTTTTTITLNCPTGIILDADKYLFIVDKNNNRIVRSNANGFRCIIGCYDSGSASNLLSSPHSMAFDNNGNIYVIDLGNRRIQKFILLNNSDQLSYNSPKLCASASWNSNGITFANSNTISIYPIGIYIDANNTIYVASQYGGRVHIWLNGSIYSIKTISHTVSYTWIPFVTFNGDIFVSNQYTQAILNSYSYYNSILKKTVVNYYFTYNYYYYIDKMISNINSSTIFNTISDQSYGLFVDISNNFYYSIADYHRVYKKPLYGSSSSWLTVAGTGSRNTTLTTLCYPYGIFVDDNFDLYVADSGNGRIQLFRLGELSATTVAGSGSPTATISLNWPTSVVLDADKYLFIVDRSNHRIVASSANGFRCIIGCLGWGKTANKLYSPWSMAFDSDGNIYVADRNNHRIQKFIVSSDSCLLSYNLPKFCSSATWYSNGTIFASNDTIGSLPSGLFVDTMNTVYAVSRSSNKVFRWYQGNSASLQTYTGDLNNSYSIFVSYEGDIYADNGFLMKQITKWISNSNTGTSTANVNGSCFGLFVDTNGTIYCSLADFHQVVQISSDGSTDVTEIVAGNGIAGSSSTQLDSPRGIFVTVNLDLYVADCHNNRIQFFPSGQLIGIELAQHASLDCPTSVVLDGDDYIFIVDSGNHRIMGSSADGFRCIIGCLSYDNDSATELNSPQTMGFDSFGNIYVTDTDNDRILKFILEDNLCAIPEPTEATIEETTQLVEIEMETTTVTVVSITCYSPFVAVIPDRSTPSSPIPVRRSQDSYIMSLIEFNCNSSLAIKIQWTMKSCTPICSDSFQLDKRIITTTSDLYLPARLLPYGLFEIQLNITIIGMSTATILKYVYIQINPSGITANLVQLGTSMITNGHENDLLLDPGSFSVDPDVSVFNSSAWKYKYYCRIYGLYKFPTAQGDLLTIDDPRNDLANPACILNRSAIKYGNTIQSSVTILGKSLPSNQTYQFMVQMENRKNASIQATGYVLVKVEDTRPQLIAIGCVISPMCVPNLEYQLVNPTTQVALFAICIGNCTNLQNITWEIYSGSIDASTNNTQWTLLNQQSTYENRWFFGTKTSNFTTTNQLFLSNPQINLWRFQVVYSFLTATSASALNFIINQPPKNGSCSISPLNGTTSTVFTISCVKWIDEDGIKDYSIYGWTADSPLRTMIGFSFISKVQTRLPAGDDQNSLVQLVVLVRDQLDCTSEFNLSSVHVVPDSQGINNLINTFQNLSNDITANPIIQLLTTANQNTVGQVLTSFSSEFNKINNKNVDQAASDGILPATISISSLTSQRLVQNTNESNETALIQFNQELNSHAALREYLLPFTVDLPITTSHSIILQSSTMAQLTQATNQLTRTFLTSAADKCYQLTVALVEISTRIAYEDAQTAATQLIQCASNLLTAVNGPLQQRTTVLDLDLSRTPAIQEEYDTDLESSNTNVFADETTRNLYYQQQTATELTKQLNQMISSLTSVINLYLNIGQNSTMNTSQVFMSLQTASVQSLANQQIQQVGQAAIRLPTNITVSLSDDSTVSIRSIMKPLAPFGSSNSNTNVSTSVSLSILDRNGNEINVATNSSHPIEILIPRDPNFILPSMILQNVTSLNNATQHDQLFQYHYVNLTDTNSVSIHLEIHPFDSNVSYLLIYKFDSIPQLNDTINKIDGWTIFQPVNLSNESIYTYFLDNEQTQNHQSLIFGLRELNSSESTNSNSRPPTINRRQNFTSDYEFRIYTSGCYYLNENNEWKSAGLRVGPLTNHELTQCFSTHLTTFAGGFRVLPEAVNWQYVFANADFMKNKTIYLTVIVMSIIYLILLIFARYKDRKDLEKLGVTPLPDNHPSDRYFYELIVFTGQRKEAGTKSQVQFVLCGDADETHVRTLADPKRTILQRGSIDAFIMSVRKPLGPLNYIRIWHDNSGKGQSSSWFLKYIIIRDLQTMEKYHFFAQQWFAIEKDDGKIERTLPVAGVLEKKQFGYILSKKAYHSVSDGHLWFSIFSRPASNQFTRVQRCTCCFVLLFFSMFLNIMYYDLKNDISTQNSTTTNGFTIGPLFIAGEQIVIGIIVDVLSLIPSIFLVQVFRRLRPRRVTIPPLHQQIYELRPNAQIKNETSIKQKKSFGFPWWFIFIAYGLCIALVVLSILFIIARGIEFGDTKTQQWLVSIISGFVSSILLTQPLKILALVVIFALLCRKSDDDTEATEYMDENQFEFDHDDDEYLHSRRAEPFFVSRERVRTNRLDQNEIEMARCERLKEVRMWSIIHETLHLICFLTFIFVLTYANRTQDSFYQVNHLRKYFDYTKINTIDDYWTWLQRRFIGKTRAQPWYNNETARYLNGYLNDKTNRLIGWGQMRQLRIKSDLCSYKKMNLTCHYDYSSSNEERNSFEIQWTNMTTKVGNTTIEQAFQYKTSDELDTYSYSGSYGRYSGGGYVYEFRGRLTDIQSRLSKLHELSWIDLNTRAVFIQFNLYNPNVQLFTCVTLLSEFLSSGNIYSQIRVEPMSLYLPLTSVSELICLVLYMIFIFELMFTECKLFFHLKSRYFREFWSLINLGLIICSWMAIGISICRQQEFARISRLFSETNGSVYINLQYSTYLNDFLTFIYGFCCFFGTIKLVRLCRFNPRLYLFIETLRNSSKELISFAIMFSFVFFAFICLFYLLFQSKLSSCSTVLRTTATLFQMSLMKFDAYELLDAAAFLGPFTFSLFIFIVVFVCMSMFISIINDNFKQTTNNLDKNHEKIYSFMVDRFIRWTGLRRPTQEETFEEYDAKMRSQYYDPIEHFPDRLDELLDVLNRIYMAQVDNRKYLNYEIEKYIE